MVKTFGNLFATSGKFCLITFNVYMPQTGYDIENKCNMVVYQQLLKNHTIIAFIGPKLSKRQKKIYNIYIRLLRRCGIYEKERQNDYLVMRNSDFFQSTLENLERTQKFENFQIKTRGRKTGRQDFVIEIVNYKIPRGSCDKEKDIYRYLSKFKRESIPKSKEELIAYPDMSPKQKIRCLNANLGGGKLGADGQWNHGNNK